MTQPQAPQFHPAAMPTANFCVKHIGDHTGKWY